MVMSNPRPSPLVQSVKQLDNPKELIRTDKRNDYITVMDFPNDSLRIAFCQCVDKCNSNDLREELDYIWNLGLSIVSMHGSRAKLFSQTVMGLAVPEFFGGKGAKVTNSNSKNNQSNE